MSEAYGFYRGPGGIAGPTGFEGTPNPSMPGQMQPNPGGFRPPSQTTVVAPPSSQVPQVPSAPMTGAPGLQRVNAGPNGLGMGTGLPSVGVQGGNPYSSGTANVPTVGAQPYTQASLGFGAQNPITPIGADGIRQMYHAPTESRYLQGLPDWAANYIDARRPGGNVTGQLYDQSMANSVQGIQQTYGQNFVPWGYRPNTGTATNPNGGGMDPRTADALSGYLNQRGTPNYQGTHDYQTPSYTGQYDNVYAGRNYDLFNGNIIGHGQDVLQSDVGGYVDPSTPYDQIGQSGPAYSLQQRYLQAHMLNPSLQWSDYANGYNQWFNSQHPDQPLGDQQRRWADAQNWYNDPTGSRQTPDSNLPPAPGPLDDRTQYGGSQ